MGNDLQRVGLVFTQDGAVDFRSYTTYKNAMQLVKSNIFGKIFK